MQRLFLLAWLLTLGLARADWQIEKIDGRPYVTLAQVATFYGMGQPGPASGKKFAASGGGHSIQVELDSREATIDGVHQWLSFPAKVAVGGPCISELDLLKTVDPALRPQNVKGLHPVRTVVLDPGHGGHDNGASSRYGYEKDFALDTARRVRKHLQAAGVKVVMTRNNDTFIDLEARPAVANRIPNSIFVSIHYNSADWKPEACGIETYALPPQGAPASGQDQPSMIDRISLPNTPQEPLSFTLANTMQHALMGKLKVVEDRGVKRAHYDVLRNATVPAILIEGGFLTNPGDAGRIADPLWREAYATAIAAGILEYKHLAETGEKPKEKADW
jgi:N-acetylmuramoyl-L-alanine amidase